MPAPRLLAFMISSLVFAPSVASAQADQAASVEAQVLFDQASALMDKHDYAGACPKLEEVRRLLPGKLGGLITLGECYEGAGRLASAWITYRQAADRATTLGDARARGAQAKADALEPRLPRLSIQLEVATKGTSGIEVKRDGLPVVAALWGVPVPVDPGEHRVEARAPGHRAFRATVTVKERESRDVVVSLERPVPAASPPVRAPASAALPVAPAAPRAATEPSLDGSGQRREGLIFGIVGAAGMSVAGVLGIVTLVKVGALPRCGSGDAACIDDQRNPGIRSAQVIQTAGFVLLGLGAAATATGIALFATAPRAPKQMTVSASAALQGATLRMAW